MKTGRFERRHLIILTFMVLLSLGYLFPHGFFAFSAPILYHPLYQVFIFLILVIAVINPALPSLNIPDKRQWILLSLCFFLVSGILFLFFQHNSLIGDTAQIHALLLQYPEGASWQQLRIVTLSIFAFLSSLFSFAGSPWKITAIIHIILGGIWGIFVGMTTKTQEEGNWLPLTGAILFSGCLFLFDHIEFYAFAMVFQAIFFYFLLRNRERWDLPLAMIFGLLAGFFHPLLLYLPGIALIELFTKKGLDFKWALSAVMGGGLVLLLLDSRFTLSGKPDIFLILSKPEYAFSLNHLRIVFNYLFVTGPTLVFLILGKRPRASLLAASIVAVMMILLLEYNFAGADRDLIAMIFYPVVLAGVMALKNSGRKMLTTGFYLTLAFLAMTLPSASSTKLEIARADQLIMHQNNPYLKYVFPQEAFIGYRLSMDFKHSKNREYLPFIEDYAFQGTVVDPEDSRSYTYLAAAYTEQEKLELAARTFLLAFTLSDAPGDVLDNTIKSHIKAGKDSFLPLGYPGLLEESVLDSMGIPNYESEQASVFAGQRKVKRVKDNYFIVYGEHVEVHIKKVENFLSVISPVIVDKDYPLRDFITYAWSKNREIYPLSLFLVDGGVYVGVTLGSARGLDEITDLLDDNVPLIERELNSFSL